MFIALLGRVEKADHSTPGFKWKQLSKRQGIKGRIYSAYPMRLKTRFWPSMGIGFLLGAMMTGGSLGGTFFVMLLIYSIALVWPAWPCGKSIKVTPERLTLGGKSYDVNEISQIRTAQKSFSKFFPSWMIQFEYGRKTIKIKNAHNEKDAYRIAEQLHQFIEEAKGVQVESIQDQATAEQYETPEQVRAAAF